MLLVFKKATLHIEDHKELEKRDTVYAFKYLSVYRTNPVIKLIICLETSKQVDVAMTEIQALKAISNLRKSLIHCQCKFVSLDCLINLHLKKTKKTGVKKKQSLQTYH